MIAATVSYPADILKTLRISYEKEYSKLSNTQIFRNVYNEGGYRAFGDSKQPAFNLTILGLKLRLSKIFVQNLTFFIGYSTFIDYYTKNPKSFPN